MNIKHLLFVIQNTDNNFSSSSAPCAKDDDADCSSIERAIGCCSLSNGTHDSGIQAIYIKLHIEATEATIKLV